MKYENVELHTHSKNANDEGALVNTLDGIVIALKVEACEVDGITVKVT